MSSWASIVKKENTTNTKDIKDDDKLSMVVLRPKPKEPIVDNKKNEKTNLTVVKNSSKKNNIKLYNNIKTKPIYTEETEDNITQDANDDYESYIDFDGWNHLTKRYEK